MSKALTIQSHKGEYQAQFNDTALDQLNENDLDNFHFIIDARVANLHQNRINQILNSRSVLIIEATEPNKSLDKFPDYVAHLVDKGLRRNHILVAIGGGIIQDITCFLSATILRGVDWRYFPTTLLSQADSCIGSKSSINCGNTKNILGTFTPPRMVDICISFLKTLDENDVRSGVGEMLKVHVIEGPDSFNQIAADYNLLFKDLALLEHYIRRSLEIKKAYIEIDEFDQGKRNIFNYGHSFGHAIEASTTFKVPHGTAVTIGMDMANYTAWRLGVGVETHFNRMHPILKSNYIGYESTYVPLDTFLAAISKDKKNVSSNSVSLILPDKAGSLFRDHYPNNSKFTEICQEYLEKIRIS